MGRYIQGTQKSYVLFSHDDEKKMVWCEKMKTDTSNQEQSHKLYGKESYEHSSRQFDVHLLEMMHYIARKEGIKRLSLFMRKSNPVGVKDSLNKNYCEPTQNSRTVQLIYDYVGNRWILPKVDDKGRSPALFHPLLNIKLLNTMLKTYIDRG